jgi:hypothetical protein
MQFKRKRVYSDMPKRPAKKEAAVTLKGWQQIVDFLGEPQSVVQRWATEGMPVRKAGRFVSTSPVTDQSAAYVRLQRVRRLGGRTASANEIGIRITDV